MKASSTAFLSTGGLDRAWADDRAWTSKLERDRDRARRNQTAAQRKITEAIIGRALAIGADAVALTGSTARDRRTSISDLDYHVVGRRPEVDDLPGDVDVYARDADHFWQKLRGGDDFVQWTLRFGCILYDSGIFRAGLETIGREALWPDPSGRMARLDEQQVIAKRLIEMGTATPRKARFARRLPRPPAGCCSPGASSRWHGASFQLSSGPSATIASPVRLRQPFMRRRPWRSSKGALQPSRSLVLLKQHFAAADRQPNTCSADPTSMQDVIKLYLFALRRGDRPLAEALGRALRFSGPPAAQADSLLQELARGPTRWSAGAERAVTRVMTRLGSAPP